MQVGDWYPGNRHEPGRDTIFHVAVDLGKWEAGVAVFGAASRTLKAATQIDIPKGPNAALRMAHAINLWVLDLDLRVVTYHCEQMQDRAGKHARKRNLQALRDVAKALRAYSPVMEMPASAWKGTTPKRITDIRIEGELSAEERRACLRWTKESRDAIGIGLYVVGRLARGMVPHR